MIEFDAGCWLAGLFEAIPEATCRPDPNAFPGNGTPAAEPFEPVPLPATKPDEIPPQAAELLEGDPLEGDALELLAEPADWGPDGWPLDAVRPETTCPRCGSLDAWQSIDGPSRTTYPATWRPEAPAWRCVTCDPPRTAERVRAQADRIRKRTPWRPAGERGRPRSTHDPSSARTQQAAP